ncbi:YdiY family protein [Halomonas rhizosphaerae]
MPHTATLPSMIRWAALCGLLTIAGGTQAGPFYAPPPPKEDDQGFSGSAELGYTHLSGNTESQTLIGKGRLIWVTGDWTQSLRGEVRNVSRNGDTSAEQYLVAGRERYELDGPHYIFGFARWEKDLFSGYDQQFTTIGGYGRDLLDGRRHRLSLEAGPGYRYDRIEGEENASLGVAYGALAYEWSFSETSSLEQEFSVEATDDNTTSRSLTSLTSRLNSHLALRLSHEIRDNSRPPEGAEARTDHTTSASLLYDW